MKIFRADQIREWDKYTIEREAISSVDLMERAGAQCARWINKHWHKEKSIYVFCGPGNNGGDGLVVARLLFQMFFNVRCYVANFSDQYSEDFLHNKQLLEKLPVPLNYLEPNARLVDISIEPDALIIDAIFGSGLNRPASGFAAELINLINGSGGRVLSIDIPSGMFCEDNSKNTNDSVVKATDTLCFGTAKLSFYLPDFGEYRGRVHILPIGLSKGYYEDTKTELNLITKEEMACLLKPRKRFTHKGSYGHVTIIAGSKGKMGAAVLAAKAALKTGAGLVSCYAPACGLDIIQTTIPEVMVEQGEGEEYLLGRWEKTERTLGIGPGLGQNPATAKLLLEVLKTKREPVVIDADALNIISKNEQFKKYVPTNSILTPHPKEFQRLVGEWSSEKEKLQKLFSFAKENSCIVVFKDAHTIVVNPDGEMYFNTTGNSGMATGGSGDVLTGIISSLLAQSYGPLDAAQLGVYIHGLSGDIASKRLGQYSLCASDIIECLPDAFQETQQSHL